jgi:hypothetical protein
MKVFNGSKFLDAHQVTMEFSNGFKAVVREIPTEVMDALAKQQTENEDVGNTMRGLMAKVCNAEVSDFADLGIIELRGAMDFLLENMFDMKSPK